MLHANVSLCLVTPGFQHVEELRIRFLDGFLDGDDFGRLAIYEAAGRT